MEVGGNALRISLGMIIEARCFVSCCFDYRGPVVIEDFSCEISG